MDEKIAREIKFLKFTHWFLTLVLLVLFYLIIKLIGNHIFRKSCKR